MNGSTYVFKKEVAKEYGLESAILIQHFQYSINHHKKNGTHFYEGRYWTYDSVSTLTNLYPFWSISTVRRVIKYLLDRNVLISRNFNKNKYDRTRWFAFQEQDRFINNNDSKDKSTSNEIRSLIGSVNKSVDKSVDKCDFIGLVDESVDKCEKPVYNPVDKFGIKKIASKKITSTDEPFLGQKSSETIGNGHLSKTTNGFVETNTPIPIYSTICISSLEEGNTNNNNNGGKLNKFNGRKNTANNRSFAIKIERNYRLPPVLRTKLRKLGHEDDHIDREVLKMIRYHEKNPQVVLNEHRCVLGWFENAIKDAK